MLNILGDVEVPPSLDFKVWGLGSGEVFLLDPKARMWPLGFKELQEDSDKPAGILCYKGLGGCRDCVSRCSKDLRCPVRAYVDMSQNSHADMCSKVCYSAHLMWTTQPTKFRLGC